MVEQRIAHKWGMVIDIDRCIGCQACVVACQAENNIPINTEDRFRQRRAIEWIHVERYWEGEFPNVKARFIPILCQHCENAPCEPVCPVNAIFVEEEVPDQWKDWVEINYDFFKDADATRAKVNQLKPPA